MDVIDVKKEIDASGMSLRQWVLLAICFLVVASDGMDVAVMGFLAPAVMQEWGLSKAAFGLVMTAAPLGLVLGALTSGPAADRFGRKAVLIASVLFFGAFTVFSALAGSAIELASWRFLTGIGLGAAMPNTTTLLSEYVPHRHRSFMVALMYTGFGAGSAVVGFLSAAIIPIHGWRSVLVLGGIFPLLLLPLIWILVPESVRFLVGRSTPNERVAKVLSRAIGKSYPIDAKFVLNELQNDRQHTSNNTKNSAVSMLVNSNYRRTSLSLWVTYFSGLLVIYLTTGWLPTLIKESGLSMANAANITAMFQTGGILGVLLVGWLMDRAKPSHIIAASYALGAACLFAVSRGDAGASNLVYLVLAAGFFMNGAQTGINALAPHLYPTAARATGVSWMQGMGRFGSIVGSSLGGVLIGLGWGFGPVMGLLAAPALLAAIAVLMLSTRGTEAAL